jgi:hypothetical protein
LTVAVSDQNIIENSRATTEGAVAMACDTYSLYWFWPERDRRSAEHAGDDEVWKVYQTAGAAQGLDVRVISVDDVTVSARPDGPVVLVQGEPIDRLSAVFHAKLYTWPEFAPDIWRSLATFQVITEAGYCNLIRPELNLITNDKTATLLHLHDVDEHWLPTLQLTTRDVGRLPVSLADAGLDYPVVVKPSSWASGNGVSVARTSGELMTTLRLARAAELTMVVQPLVEPPLEDVRVFCVNGNPVGALRRTPPDGSTVANGSAGGRAEVFPLPADLHRRASAIATRLGSPWLGVDFLGGNGTYYLSEVEIDAAIPQILSRLPGMDRILAQRFAAYRERFESWLAETSFAATAPSHAVRA